MMGRRYAERTNKGFEVQWYDNNGNYSEVVGLDTIEELALYLSKCLWGQLRFRQNPTVWYNGARFDRMEVA